MANLSLRASVLFLLLCAVGSAMAQYVWKDEKGGRVYSDRPPPADVPVSRILKTPGDADKAAAAASAPAAPAPASPTKGELTLAERNAEFNKRRAAQAEKDKKSTDEAAQKADRKAGCERAREYNAALESGERLTRTDSSGERGYLSDEQREKETRDVKKVLAECK